MIDLFAISTRPDIATAQADRPTTTTRKSARAANAVNKLQQHVEPVVEPTPKPTKRKQPSGGKTTPSGKKTKTDSSVVTSAVQENTELTLEATVSLLDEPRPSFNKPHLEDDFGDASADRIDVEDSDSSSGDIEELRSLATTEDSASQPTLTTTTPLGNNICGSKNCLC